MKPAARNTMAMVAAALAFAFAAPVPAEDHAAHRHGAQYAKLDVNAGNKWSTDEALRAGMENIRTALASELAVLKSSRRLSAEEYASLATWIDDEVAGIVQNCKLDPQADAQLHEVLAQITAGSEGMNASQTRLGRRIAAQRVVRALEDYQRLFDHPGWQNV